MPLNFETKSDLLANTLDNRRNCRLSYSERWPVNAARHSFGSYWLAQFNDINVLAVQMGNSPTVIEKHYKRAVKPKEAHRYWQIMPSAGAAKKLVAFAAQ